MSKKIIERLQQLYVLCYSNINKGNKNAKKCGDEMTEINKKLEKEANAILLKNDMLKLPVDLIKIAKNNNIEVYSTNLPNGISGAIRYNKKLRKFQILIEKDESDARQRFTLAHELAHFFLEKEKMLCEENIHFDTLYRRSKNPGEEDVEYLASAILMDKMMLTKLYELCPSVPLLADTFGVSKSAMTVRINKLGLK